MYDLVVAEVRERWSVNKHAAQKFCGERFNIRKLNELGIRKHYEIAISNGFSTWENLVIART
jgi:hypothetical protein